MIKKTCIFAIAGLITSAASASFGQSVILDNTSNGTAAIPNNAYVDSGFKRGLTFTVGSGQTLDLGTLKLGLKNSSIAFAHVNATVAL